MTTIKETLIDLFKLDKMPENKSEQVLERLAKLVFQGVLLKALPILSEADLQEYEKIVDEKQNPEFLFHFLNEKVPNFENMIKEEAEILRAEFAGEIKNLQN
ncbi:DUF5663 domain-containing protein [Candidatus Nomurabacteria bacterium]|nr:DUF5663 domain-containing protein [Candidatus Nomurabacteria bacterium]